MGVIVHIWKRLSNLVHVFAFSVFYLLIDFYMSDVYPSYLHNIHCHVHMHTCTHTSHMTSLHSSPRWWPIVLTSTANQTVNMGESLVLMISSTLLERFEACSVYTTLLISASSWLSLSLSLSLFLSLSLTLFCSFLLQLTYGLAEKEFNRKGSAGIGRLELTDSVKAKVKDYIRQYMKKFGSVYYRTSSP